MSLFIINILVTNITYILTGKLFLKKINYNNQINSIESGIIGIIIISFLALSINFFFSLNEYINFFVTIIIIFLSIINKIHFKKIDVIFYIIIFIITLSLLLFTNEYRPDAGLYHLPYTQILNENKILIGISNLHFRFGHISIIQYLSAFNINFLTGREGIIIPLASITSFVYLYFIYDLYKLVKRKENISIGKLFSLIIVLYISYKINRYGEYGNDAPAHLMLFFVVSYFLYNSNTGYKSFYLLTLISTFIFANKVFLGLCFILPLYLLIKRKSFFLKIFISVPSIFFALWFLKNILITGCLLYPIKNSCLKNLEWTDINRTEIVQVESEAWSKAWPENKNKNLSHKEFIKNFNWIDAWSDKHLKYILKVVVPYIFVLVMIFLYMGFSSKNKKGERLNINNYKEKRILYFFSSIGLILFFLKFPIYRYGYSYIIIFLFLIFLSLFKSLDKNKIIKCSKFVIIFSIITMSGKQITRISENYNKRNFFPDHVFINSSNFDRKYDKRYLSENLSLYYSSEECFYGLAPCTNYRTDFEKIKYNTKYKYIILYKD